MILFEVGHSVTVGFNMCRTFMIYCELKGNGLVFGFCKQFALYYHAYFIYNYLFWQFISTLQIAFCMYQLNCRIQQM